MALGALLALAVGGAALWTSRQEPQPPAFSYLQGAPTLPAAVSGSQEVVFWLSSTRGQQTFTLAQLMALPAVQYRAIHPQLKRSFVYTGVPLRDLAQLAGLSGQDVRVLSDDQFGATISAEDYQAYPVMLAYLVDGAPAPAALKGPLQIVFPSEQHASRFVRSGYGSQWVWFVASMGAAPTARASTP